MDWMTVLTYSLPPAFLVQLFNWLFNRQMNKAKGEQGAVEALMRINDNLSSLVERQSYDNKNLFIQCTNLRRAATKCNDCRYVSICPVVAELRKHKAYNQPEQPVPRSRQRNGEVDYDREALNGSQVTGIPPPGFD